jgi:hypothetical protein
MNEGTLIHLGTIGMAIPPIYTDVIAKIYGYHLAVESVLVKYILQNNLTPKTRQFDSRLAETKRHLKGAAKDWSIEACGKLNTLRNKCSHIDTAEYKLVEQRIQVHLEALLEVVHRSNKRHELHTMSDFVWACTMIFQRLHELLAIPYAPMILGDLGSSPSLPRELARYFDNK